MRRRPRLQPDALNPVVERLRPGHCRQVECRNGHDARQHVGAVAQEGHRQVALVVDPHLGRSRQFDALDDRPGCPLHAHDFGRIAAPNAISDVYAMG
ncbi:MAG: hypothetical protein ACO225_02160, partial [Ilumatobacteraceae bacterium]